MSECSQEWVRQELVRWEEGLNAKVVALQLEVEDLKRRLLHIENHLSGYVRCDDA